MSVALGCTMLALLHTSYGLVHTRCGIINRFCVGVALYPCRLDGNGRMYEHSVDSVLLRAHVHSVQQFELL